jgi:hypothetical protein
MEVLYSTSKTVADVDFTSYQPRAVLVEKDILSFFASPHSVCVNSINDYGGDRGQIASHLFKKTKSSYTVIEYNSKQDYLVPTGVESLSRPNSRLHLSLHVLEHIQDLHAFLDTLVNCFTPQDILFVEVPHEAPNCVIASGHYEHVQFFTKESLEKLFQIYGLRYESRYCIGYGRSIPCIQIVAVRHDSTLALRRDSSPARFIYSLIVRSPLGFRFVLLLLNVMKKGRFSHLIREYK